MDYFEFAGSVVELVVTAAEPVAVVLFAVDLLLLDFELVAADLVLVVIGLVPVEFVVDHYSSVPAVPPVLLVGSPGPLAVTVDGS